MAHRLRFQYSCDNNRTNRQFRPLASQSDEIVFSQRGYRHIQFASDEDVALYPHELESCAHELAARARRVRRRAYQLVC